MEGEQPFVAGSCGEEAGIDGPHLDGAVLVTDREDAQLKLARCYAGALGCEKDEKAAMERLRAAAKSGNKNAREELATRGIPG